MNTVIFKFNDPAQTMHKQMDGNYSQQQLEDIFVDRLFNLGTDRQPKMQYCTSVQIVPANPISPTENLVC